jgi:hypothetical protein
VKRSCFALLLSAALFQTSAVLADPPPAPTSEASMPTSWAFGLAHRRPRSSPSWKPLFRAFRSNSMRVRGLTEHAKSQGSRGPGIFPTRIIQPSSHGARSSTFTSPRRHPEIGRFGSPARQLSLTARKYPRKPPFRLCSANTVSRPTSDALASITNRPTEL